MSLDDLKEIKIDIKEIKVQVQELVKQGALMNQTLIEHERRSTNLETRVVPLEKTNTILIFCLTLAAGLLSILKLFFK